MITTNARPGSKYLRLVRQGTNGAPEGSEKLEVIEMPPLSRLICDAFGRFRAQPFSTAQTVFNLLPNLTSAAAGKDDLIVTIGTGTEVPTRSAKGGINVKTQATTPADNDNAILVSLTGSGMITPITAVSQPRFSTRVILTQITELVFGAGFDENWTSPIPSATAGDGASFYFDPADEAVTGLAGAATNWLLWEKVNGVDRVIDSGVPVLAGVPYELEVQIGADLKPAYYINGNLIDVSGTWTLMAGGTATGPAALTSGDSVGPVIGVQINAETPAGQKDFDCRYIAVERFGG
jgi:hypothetical protein